MTQKEKAKELVSKMENNFQYFANTEIAKRHALIAVDEILNSWYPVNVHFNYEFNHDNLTTSFHEYWEEVKQEIQTL